MHRCQKVEMKNMLFVEVVGIAVVAATVMMMVAEPLEHPQYGFDPKWMVISNGVMK